MMKLKIKNLIKLSLFLIAVQVSQAQLLVDFKDENGKIGFKLKDVYGNLGEILVQPKYDDFKYCDLNCIAEISQQYGVYNHNFGTGLTQVMLNGKVGLVNNKGEEIVAPKYDYIGACGYHCGEVIETAGDLIEDKTESENYYSTNYLETCGFMNHGEDFYIKIKLNNKTGYINFEGQEMIPPLYDELNISYRSINSIFFEAKLNNKWGLLDKNGHQTISFKYDDINYRGLNPFFASVKINENWQFIDSTEKPIEIQSITDSTINGIKFYKFYIKQAGGYEVFDELSKNIIIYENILINKTEKKIISVFDHLDKHFEENPNFVSMNHRDKYWVIDSLANEIIPPKKYNKIGSTYGGLTMVKIIDSLIDKEEYYDCCYRNDKNKYKIGFINNTGKEVIPLMYEEVKDFNDEKAEVKLNNKWGLINTKGEYIIPTIYDEIIYDNNNFYRVKLNDKYGLIDTIGREITPVKYNLINEFNKGFAEVLTDSSTGGWGVINKKGQEIIPLKYESINFLYSGVFKIQSNKKFGIIDTNGKEIVPAIYDNCYYDSQGFVSVELNKKKGATDSSGKLIIPIKYDEVTFLDKNYVSVRFNEKWGVITINNKHVVPLIYNSITNLYTNKDIISVVLNKKSALLNLKTGNVITPFKYDDISHANQELIIATLFKKQVLLNSTTCKEITPIKYDEIAVLNNNVFKVRFNKKYGVINSSGKEIIPPIYNQIENYYRSDSLLKVNVSGKNGGEGKWGLINYKGKLIVPAKYNSIRESDGKAYVNDGEREFYIDYNGNETK